MSGHPSGTWRWRSALALAAYLAACGGAGEGGRDSGMREGGEAPAIGAEGPLARTFEAHGGLGTWRRYGAVEYDLDRRFRETAGADHQLVDLRSRHTLITAPEYTVGFDGERVWIVPDPEALDYGAPPRFYARTYFYFFGLPFVFADPGARTEALGTRTLGGERYDVVRVTYGPAVGDSPDDVYHAYLDPESGRLELALFSVTYGRNEAPAGPTSAVVYEEWQEVDGLRVPRRIGAYEYAEGRLGERIGDAVYSSVDFRVERPEAGWFVLPDSAVVDPPPDARPGSGDARAAGSGDSRAAGSGDTAAAEPGGGRTPPGPVLASNAFFYYRDVEAARAFYSDVLGVETVADYGFAKILRLASTSFLILVDAAEGMHSADEPKTVTLSLITDDLEAWWDRLRARELEVVQPFEPSGGRAREAFVVRDPEGYTLELLRVNDHPDVAPLRERLDGLEPVAAAGAPGGDGAAGPGILGTVLWLYYDEPDAVLPFYRDGVGLEPLLSEPWGHTLAASPSGFFGLGRSGAGLHEATDETGVTASFWVRDVDAWFRHMRGRQGFELRTPEVVEESGLVRVFVGYDPRGRFLEWDTFLAGPENEALLPLIYSDTPPS